MSLFGGYSCRNACSPSDPATDTVRIEGLPDATPSDQDFSQLPLESRWDAGEGRAVELHAGDRLVVVGAKSQAEADMLVEQWQKLRAEGKIGSAAAADAAARFKEADEVADRAEEARLAREKEEREREEKELQIQKELEAKHALERKQEMERQQELARQQEEAARLQDLAREQELAKEKEKAEREAQLLAERQRKEQVEAFLKKNAFASGVNGPKVVSEACGLPFMSKSIYPIHCAAELGNVKMIELLIQEGADPMQKTSGGKTAAELAQKKNKSGSHDAVLRLLGVDVKTSGRSGSK
eukprot:TRINITY_DN49042_c0_g1_i1.p1 TRINITY_DN49042_c0_g1~~TRINITY_DN49042_c0_g1_i1.p1  ORF type:complete len:324 (-),score=86.62 TRINITY_DN49042_c0_g1_i1:43-936(-)